MLSANGNVGGGAIILACFSSLSPLPVGAGDAIDKSSEMASLLHGVIGRHFLTRSHHHKSKSPRAACGFAAVK